MKITGTHPTKLNDPILKNPAMHGKRWAIDYAYGPHTSFGKLSKSQVDEFAVNNMDTWTDTKHNDVDIGYNEFYEDLKPANKLTGGVGDTTAPHSVDPVELSLGQTIEMEHTTDPDIATEIALDHLSEDPKYYTKLRKAGLAKELDIVNASSGFGDPDHPINDKKRLGSDITCTAGNNIVGKIGNTPDGHIEGFSDKTSIINKNLNTMNNKTNDFTVDVDIEEPSLEEGKNSPTNKELWARALAAARSKFNVYPCVPLDTQAITKTGLKYYDELIEGEQILSYNIQKDILEWSSILKLNYFENAPLKRIYKPTGFSLRATENHKWVVKRGANYQNTELVETKNLNKHMQIICCATLENTCSNLFINENWSKKDSWVEKVFSWDKERREIFLGSAIIYDGHDQGSSTKILDRHTFGFTQKNTDHLWACLFAAYLNGYHVSFANKTDDIYSATIIRNKKTHNTQNLKIEDDGIEDVWCPTTENNTWVMVQNGFITITGNSAYANAWAAKWYKKHGGGWRKNKTNESVYMENAEMSQSDLTKIIDYSAKLQSMFNVNDNLEDWVKAKLNHACDYVATVRDYLKFYIDEKEAGTPEDQINEKWSMKYKRSIDCSNPKGFGQKAHCRARQLRKAGKSTKSKPVKECYKEAIQELLKEQNSSMAMGALKQLHNDAKEIVTMLTAETKLEDWVKSKLNLAGEYLDDVYHHLDHFGPSGRKYNNSLNESSNSGGITTGQNPTGKVSSIKQPTTTTSTGQAQATNPKINSGYGGSHKAVEGSGEETLHDRPYDFFQYKKDNSKFGNGNIIKKNGRVSLAELAKQILNDEK